MIFLPEHFDYLYYTSEDSEQIKDTSFILKDVLKEGISLPH